MSRDPRRIAAAAAAVMEYLAAERRAEHGADGPRAAGELVGAAGPRYAAGSLWSVQGRSEGMQLRGLMQWRALRRS